MGFIDFILPYRFWLRKKYKVGTDKLVDQFTFVPYNPQIIVPELRKEFKQYQSEQGDYNQNWQEGLKHRFNKTIDQFSKGSNASYVAGAEAGLFLGMDVFSAYRAVDESVYEGMSKLAGENLDSLGDLSSKATSYEHDFYGLSESALSKVGGHVGESVFAESLQEKGMCVEWPESSNQAGWDLLVNGHEVNVKTVADASSLKEHFASYPDIPALIPGDAANIPENAINIGTEAGLDEFNQAMEDGVQNIVAFDPGVSGSEIMSQTEEATDFLTGAGDIFDAFIPVVTLGFSSFREVKLLFNEHTNLASAAKNIGLDVLGSGGGGAAGVVIGAGIGSIFPGAGTIIGGIIGGIAGAIGGRKGTDAIKKRAFKKAFEEYQTAYTQFNLRAEAIIKQANETIDSFKRDVSAEIKRGVQNSKSEISKQEILMRKKVNEKNILKLTEINQLVQQAQEKIAIREKEVKSELGSISSWKQIFWPNEETFAFHRIQNHLQKIRSTVETFGLDNHEISLGEFAKLFGRTGLEKDVVLEKIMDSELSRLEEEKKLRLLINNETARAVLIRKSKIKQINNFIKNQNDLARTKINALVSPLREKQKKVEIEKKKLGIA